MALAGSVIGVAGLFFKGATTDGEELLPTLSQANEAFPDGIPTIWGGLDTWAQVLVVVALIIVVVLAVRPPVAEPEDRMASIATIFLGGVLLIYAVFKLLEAQDDAAALEAAFGQAAGAGLIPAAFTVTAGIGFFIVIVGTAVVAIGGVFSLLGGSSDND